MPINLDKIITEARDNIGNSVIVRKIGKHFFRGSSSKLYVIIPYWQATIYQLPMRILRKRILKAGHSCLIYQFPIKILSANVHLTEQYFKDIQAEIKKDIKEIKQKHNFLEVDIIGMSLGCVNTLMVANKNPDINKLFLIVPGDSLSESLWRGVGTKKLKNQIKKHHINLEELEKDWKDLEPKNNIDGLFDKEIEVYISGADTVIPYNNGHRLVKDMQNIGLNPTVFKNKRLGHYFTPFYFIISKKF